MCLSGKIAQDSRQNRGIYTHELGPLTWMQMFLYFMLFSWLCEVGRYPLTVIAAPVSDNYMLTPNLTKQLYEKLHLRRRRGKSVVQVKETWNILNRFPLMNDKLEKIRGVTPTAAPENAETGLWAVKLRFGNADVSRDMLDITAEMIAKRHGLENHGQIGELKGKK